MKQPSLVCIVGSLATILCPITAFAHSPYGKVVKERYDLRSVSCYACHQKGKDKKTGKPLGKEHLNPFGDALHAVLKDKKITERIEAAKKLSREERNKVNEAAAAEFLKAMEKIEKKSAAGGKTWLQRIKSGELDGIKLGK